jgi:hypothetical protein
MGALGSKRVVMKANGESLPPPTRWRRTSTRGWTRRTSC